MVRGIVQKQLKAKPSQSKNFSLGTFFDDLRGKIIIIYRQGEAITVDINTRVTQIQILTNKNFGQAMLFRNDTLLLQGTTSIDFFHLKK
jgi:hypothetical protein